MSFGDTIIPVIQGQFQVSGQESDVFSTVLGSCVAACLYDPLAKIGGMNHFLLPGSDPSAGNNVKYGAHSMEQLINGMLRIGAQRHRLEAQLFGGGNIAGTFSQIGENNAKFAKEFVQSEGFILRDSDLGGKTGRRLRFSPYTGVAKSVAFEIPQAVADAKPPQQSGADLGEVEFF